MAKVSAIILGAGLSRRMGKENKLLLPIHGKPMIEWVIDNVNASIVNEIILVANDLSIHFLSQFKSDRIRVIENKHYTSGMTSSIQAGVRVSDADGYLICLGDQPKISTHNYNQIIESFKLSYLNSKSNITVPYYQQQKGNPVIFSKVHREAILSCEQPEGCKEIIQANKNHLNKVDIQTDSILIDLDTPKDFEKLH